VFPLRHRLRVIARQQAAAHEHAQQSLAYRLLHPRDGGGINPGDRKEDDPARGGGVEHTVDDHAVKVQVRIGGNLASYKKPWYVVLVESLPRNMTNKINKNALRAQWAELGQAPRP